MEKPWDVKDLEARLKGQGLVVAEHLIAVLVKEALDWVKDSSQLAVAQGQSPLLALVGPVVEAIRPQIMLEVDKIDGVKS